MKKPRKRRNKSYARIFNLYLPLLLFVLFIGIPLFWAISMSLREGSTITKGIFSFLPQKWTLENYRYVWVNNKLSVYFVNSLKISFAAVAVIAVLSLLNGYALSRFDFFGKRAFMILLLMTQMIPLIFNMSAIFILLKNLQLVNKLSGLVVLNIAAGLSFNSLMMKSFIGSVPKEVDEASLIDGCNRVQTIFMVILPPVIPGFITVVAYAFINCWNEYLLAYTLLTTSSKYPISVGLRYLVGEYSTNYAALAAGSILALIPPIALFAYVQKHLVTGMSAGAVKG